jgi:hypothetical protein
MSQRKIVSKYARGLAAVESLESRLLLTAVALEGLKNPLTTGATLDVASNALVISNGGNPGVAEEAIQQCHTILRRNRLRSWLNRAFARPERQVARHYIDAHQREHQHHRGPDSPISVCMPPKMMARMNVIPWLGTFALYIVLVITHFVPNKISRRD